MSDYSEREFRHDVNEADRLLELEIIDRETYNGKIEYYAKTYGLRKKLTKEILKNRNIRL